MARTYEYSVDFDKETEELFKKATFLGEGHNGIVYRLPGNKIVKIFREENCCRQEWEILKRVKNSKYFPKIYGKGKFYIVRDMVEGERLDHYIKKNGFNYEIAKKLYYLLQELKRLKFTKLDMRCRDIYICPNNKIMVIDPKKCYKKKVTYPRHLMKGLYKLDVLESFIEDIRVINYKISDTWEKNFNLYLEKVKKEKVAKKKCKKR